VVAEGTHYRNNCIIGNIDGNILLYSQTSEPGNLMLLSLVVHFTILG
jgi:hypothetical protein